MIYVPDRLTGIEWYQRAFPKAQRIKLPPEDFECLEYGGVLIEIVSSDEKSVSGCGGSIVYWATSDFALSLQHFLDIGAEIYRGPLTIEGGQRMCQVRDPWGNCLGLRGPYDEKRDTELDIA
jgi:predicted enzyme related to lactoylglutathione lyase